MGSSEPPNQQPSSSQSEFGHASEPEWQCKAAELGEKSFFDQPSHCQRAQMESLSFPLEGLLSARKTESNPQRVGTNLAQHEAIHAGIAPVNLTATDKPSSEQKAAAGAVPAASIPDDEESSDSVLAAVEVRDDEIPGFVDASQSGLGLQTTVQQPLNSEDQEKYDKKRSKLLKRLGGKKLSSDCRDLLAKVGGLNEVIKAVGLQRPFDGTASTISQFDAGLLNNNDLGRISEGNRQALIGQSVAFQFSNVNPAATAMTAANPGGKSA